jgi:hypothetical protein
LLYENWVINILKECDVTGANHLRGRSWCEGWNIIEKAARDLSGKKSRPDSICALSLPSLSISTLNFLLSRIGKSMGAWFFEKALEIGESKYYIALVFYRPWFDTSPQYLVVVPNNLHKI